MRPELCDLDELLLAIANSVMFWLSLSDTLLSAVIEGANVEGANVEDMNIEGNVRRDQRGKPECRSSRTFRRAYSWSVMSLPV